MIKPCPFCGIEPIKTYLPSKFIVQCGNPYCNVRARAVSNRDWPVEAWNTRAEEPAEKTAHWDINTDGYYPFCSHCGEAAERMSPHCPNCGYRMTTRRHGE